MPIHYRGRCVTCSQEIDILSVLPQDRQCVDCQYFKKAAKSQKQPSFTSSEFWRFFDGWPDRRLDKKEAAHAAKIWPAVLRCEVSGEGRWLKILFLRDSGCFCLEK